MAAAVAASRQSLLLPEIRVGGGGRSNAAQTAETASGTALVNVASESNELTHQHSMENIIDTGSEENEITFDDRKASVPMIQVQREDLDDVTGQTSAISSLPSTSKQLVSQMQRKALKQTTANQQLLTFRGDGHLTKKSTIGGPESVPRGSPNVPILSKNSSPKGGRFRGSNAQQH